MLSVVILSYNTGDITLKCLEFLYKSQGVDFETIVIDNASTDGSTATIAKKFPQVKLIANKSNVGFAAGNNQGMKLAKGNTLLLLNSDCFVYPDTLSKCLKQMQTHDVLGCQLLNPDSSIQPSWGYFPTLRRIAQLMLFVDNFPIVRAYIDSIHVRDLGRFQNSRGVDWLTAAFVMLKASIFRKTGGIDEKYFMYGEETEWMFRIRKLGFDVYYYPEARAIHLQGASTKSISKMFASEMKGYLYWFTKHNPSWQLPILKVILIVGTFYKALAWTMLGGILGKPTWGNDNWETFKQIKSEVFGLSRK